MNTVFLRANHSANNFSQFIEMKWITGATPQSTYALQSSLLYQSPKLWALEQTPSV